MVWERYWPSWAHSAVAAGAKSCVSGGRGAGQRGAGQWGTRVRELAETNIETNIAEAMSRSYGAADPVFADHLGVLRVALRVALLAQDWGANLRLTAVGGSLAGLVGAATVNDHDKDYEEDDKGEGNAVTHGEGAHEES